MRPADWTYYHEQDQVDPAEYHPNWPTGMRELGPIRIPAGSESQRRIPPLSPTYVGRTLWRKIADLKQQLSWGNVQEQPGIFQHMRTTDAAIENDPDWKRMLRRYREDPRGLPPYRTTYRRGFTLQGGSSYSLRIPVYFG